MTSERKPYSRLYWEDKISGLETLRDNKCDPKILDQHIFIAKKSLENCYEHNVISYSYYNEFLTRLSCIQNYKLQNSSKPILINIDKNVMEKRTSVINSTDRERAKISLLELKKMVYGKSIKHMNSEGEGVSDMILERTNDRKNSIDNEKKLCNVVSPRLSS